MTWDDHDLFDDWGSDPALRRTNPLASKKYDAVEGVYRRYQRSLVPAKAGASLDYGVHLGPVAVYVMDLRSERGVDSQFPILGRTQLDRLKAWFANLDSVVRLAVVVCSVPLTFVNNRTIRMGMEMGIDLTKDLADQWNYPGDAKQNLFDNRPDLTRMLDALFAAQIPGKRQVIAVGGYVHCGYGHMLAQDITKKRIYSFTTSALACDLIDESFRKILKNGVRYKDKELVGGYRGTWLEDSLFYDFNYGELTYEAKTDEYSFTLIDENGFEHQVFKGHV